MSWGEVIKSVGEGIQCHSVSDCRLSEVYDQARGCGGVAIFWKKELSVLTLICHSNGRVCSIQIQLSEGRCTTVYMPSDGYTEEYLICLSKNHI